MAFASTFIIPLLFGILVSCTGTGTKMTTVIQILNPTTNTWHSFIAELNEEDNFGGYVTGICADQFGKALGVQSDIQPYSVFQKMLQDTTQPLQLIIERNSTNRLTKDLKEKNIRFANTEKIFSLDFNYDLPTIELSYESDRWEGFYNDQTNEIKIISKNKKDIETLWGLLYMEQWKGQITNLDKSVLQKTFKKLISNGSTENNGLYSETLVFAESVIVCAVIDQTEMNGYVYPALGKMELNFETEELTAVEENIKKSVWGWYYLDEKKEMFQTIKFTNVEARWEKLMVNYVQAVRLNLGKIVFTGLTTDCYRQIQVIGTKEKLDEFKGLIPAGGWRLDLGMYGTKDVIFEPQVEEGPKVGDLLSLNVTYK